MAEVIHTADSILFSSEARGKPEHRTHLSTCLLKTTKCHLIESLGFRKIWHYTHSFIYFLFHKLYPKGDSITDIEKNIWPLKKVSHFIALNQFFLFLVTMQHPPPQINHSECVSVLCKYCGKSNDVTNLLSDICQSTHSDLDLLYLHKYKMLVLNSCLSALPELMAVPTLNARLSVCPSLHGQLLPGTRGTRQDMPCHKIELSEFSLLACFHNILQGSALHFLFLTTVRCSHLQIYFKNS